MPDSEDTNAAIWKTDIGVNFWKSTANDRERRRAGHRVLMAELLPFGPGEPFTFVDLGPAPGRPRGPSSTTSRRPARSWPTSRPR